MAKIFLISGSHFKCHVVEPFPWMMRSTLPLQENYEVLSRCIKENLGFKGGKPLAACIIYKCLLNWHAFESERTVIFDYIIEGINDALKVILLFQSLAFLFTILC